MATVCEGAGAYVVGDFITPYAWSERLGAALVEALGQPPARLLPPTSMPASEGCALRRRSFVWRQTPRNRPPRGCPPSISCDPRRCGIDC